MDARSSGATAGVRTVLRLEGLALFVAGLALYAHAHAAWSLFLVLFLAPDIAFAFYLLGARAGAVAYNATHSTVGPFLLFAAANIDWPRHGWVPSRRLLALALIWFAHVGFDRMLGFGLKYARGFGETHLGRIGKASLPPA